MRLAWRVGYCGVCVQVRTVRRLEMGWRCQWCREWPALQVDAPLMPLVDFLLREWHTPVMRHVWRPDTSRLVCEVCGTSMIGMRRQDARVCGPACRRKKLIHKAAGSGAVCVRCQQRPPVARGFCHACYYYVQRHARAA